MYYKPNAGAGWVIPDNIDGLYINVETQAASSDSSFVPGWDLNPFTAIPSNLSWSNSSGGGQLRYPGITTGPAGNLPLGTTVSSTGSYNTFATPVVFGANPGNWQLNASNYFGFRFIAADSLIHFGWGRMDVGATPSTRSIMEIGYESIAGTSILVGAGSAPPASVPGPLPLFGATAAFGWSRRLRRRTLQASRHPATVPALPSYTPPA
ncbi:MAG: hypothetical protein NTW51_16200 [Cyanobacteria bacterium]|nr:hypothetical protein [Cyanobacteriota bacterium]